MDEEANLVIYDPKAEKDQIIRLFGQIETT